MGRTCGVRVVQSVANDGTKAILLPCSRAPLKEGGCSPTAARAGLAWDELLGVSFLFPPQVSHPAGQAAVLAHQAPASGPDFVNR